MKVIKWSDGNYMVDGEFVEADTLEPWQVTLYDQIAKPRKPARSKRRTTSRRSYTSKRTNYAAQVVSRYSAMAELVERVNDDDEITD